MTENKTVKARVFELDFLRGLALLMMVLHHLIYDLRFLLKLDVFAFQETWWFDVLLQPFFLNIFLTVSGISCSFSRSNARRGLRLLLLASALSLVTFLASEWSTLNDYIFFNVLHVLAVGILLYAWITRMERRNRQGKDRVDVVLLIASVLLVWGASWLPVLQNAGYARWWLIPVGLVPEMTRTMTDYMPLVPWLGIFFLGTLIGRRLYVNRQTRFPNAPGWLLSAVMPVEWMGQHSLLIYVLHQPVLLAVLYGLRAAGLI